MFAKKLGRPPIRNKGSAERQRKHRRRSRYAHWRAATLILVYVLMAAHITHWLVAGKTLAPLELNEVMYTFELGIVTAGFVFMTAAVLATAFFGRFFCSWGCHILALQDLCAWILKKLRIRPKAVRSRLLLWVPAIAALYMFVWPQVVRIWQGRTLPKLHLATDADGWASFATEQFWRNLPGPGVTILTFLICGFLIVYVLGTRGFCFYGCPYGAVFGLADRMAPGRIRVGSDCLQCGTCTSVCSSHVRVHEELNRYGMVVNPACMKDLDCVSACPQQSLHFGFGRPALAKRRIGDVKVRKRYDFTLWEEGMMVAVLLAVLIIFRGLYDRVPFLMTIGLGVIVAYSCVILIRLIHQPDVKFNRWQLKSRDRLLPRGRPFVGAMVLFGAFTVHSALIRYHSFQGRRYFVAVDGAGDKDGACAGRALGHLNFVDRWGLFATDRTDSMLADLYTLRARWAEAESHLLHLLERAPGNVHARVRLARILGENGRREEALHQYRTALQLNPKNPDIHYDLAGLFFGSGRGDQAMKHLREAVRIRPDFAEAHYDLGALLVETGDVSAGLAHLRRAIKTNPSFADAHYNLGVALAMTGALNEALAEIDKAAELRPNDEQMLAFRRYLLDLGMGRTSGAAKDLVHGRGND